MKFRKRRVIPLAFAVLSLLGAGISSGVSRQLYSTQISQQAAERWAADSGDAYAQVSVFFSRDASFLESSAAGIREAVDAALVTASLESENEDARLWYDCYSAQRGTADVRGTKKNSASALVTAVGGDFFRMHPLPLLDGSYFSPDDLMHDRVVIDETLAWQTFGSSEVAGMELVIDDMTYQIAGVVAREDDKTSAAAYGEDPRVYMSFSSALNTRQRQNEDGGDIPDDTPSIDCYEAVLPNPVRGFAEQTLTDAIGEREGFRIIQNTTRTSLTNRWNTLRHLREMVIVSDRIAYPYWENAARMTDFTAAQLLGVTIFFLVFPVLYGLWLLWRGYRLIDAFIKKKREQHKRKFRTIEKDPYSV